MNTTYQDNGCYEDGVWYSFIQTNQYPFEYEYVICYKGEIIDTKKVYLMSPFNNEIYRLLNNWNRGTLNYHYYL